MTSILVFGDTHFRSNHPRNAARIASVEQIVQFAVRNEGQLGAWIHVGDVFDCRSSVDDRNVAASIFITLARFAPGVVLYGNHDAPGDLDILGKLDTEYPITVVTYPQIVSLGLATGQNAAFFCIPYLHKTALVAAGTPHDQLGNVAREALNAFCLHGDLELRSARRQSGAVTLLCGHGTIGGCVTSVGQPMGLDGDIAIEASHLSMFGNIPKVFGHIHKPQEILSGVYTGSVAPNDYGETERKRFLVIHYADDGLGVIEGVSLDTPPLYHVEGDLADGEFTWRVKKGPDGPIDIPPESFEGAEVRVRYRFNADERIAIDEDRIRAPFTGATRIDLDPIAMRKRAMRAPEVAAAVTLEGKVQAFVRGSGGDWTPGMERKLAALQKPDGAAFLTEMLRELLPEQQEPVGAR